ncbi:MAG TPA: pyrroloquinoline quinone biosynthesis peptide chaperone PqqD [Polyangia bacterium]|jgi:coenzyme PQQ biosynthesis protein PqqD|nr:pyrroloquinoline quinone biosynthesis peptide chaperone PqqD [Polyangia bacterium]
MNFMDGKPRLARKARLKKDPQTGRMMLIYPERGLELSTTAAAIAELCTGDRTARDIIQAMLERFDENDRGRVEGEVEAFLRSLVDRGLLIVDEEVQ